MEISGYYELLYSYQSLLTVCYRQTRSSVSLPLMGPSPMSYSCMLMASSSGQLEILLEEVVD